MIKYELVKQLKNAGFQQEGYGKLLEDPNAPYPSSPTKDGGSWKEAHDKYMDGLSYSPTLSELIEACGDKFDGIIRFYEGWVAGCNFGYEWFDDTQANGSTPEEAVAKLWLELIKLDK